MSSLVSFITVLLYQHKFDNLKNKLYFTAVLHIKQIVFISYIHHNILHVNPKTTRERK
jgi:hypothetical protein